MDNFILKPHENKTKSLNEKIVIVIGNSGVGKSTICNFIKHPHSKDFDSHYGIAHQFEEDYICVPARLDGHIVCDTPAFDESQSSVKIKRAFDAASKKSNHVKICFVITPVNGRIRSDDMYMIKAVMQALPTNCMYSVIVNMWKNDNSYSNNLIESLYRALNFFGKPKCDFRKFIDILYSYCDEAPQIHYPEHIMFIPMFLDNLLFLDNLSHNNESHVHLFTDLDEFIQKMNAIVLNDEINNIIPFNYNS